MNGTSMPAQLLVAGNENDPRRQGAGAPGSGAAGGNGAVLVTPK
jgi:hypothetical protein